MILFGLITAMTPSCTKTMQSFEKNSHPIENLQKDFEECMAFDYKVFTDYLKALEKAELQREIQYRLEGNASDANFPKEHQDYLNSYNEHFPPCGLTIDAML